MEKIRGKASKSLRPQLALTSVYQHLRCPVAFLSPQTSLCCTQLSETYSVTSAAGTSWVQTVAICKVTPDEPGIFGLKSSALQQLQAESHALQCILYLWSTHLTPFICENYLLDCMEIRSLTWLKRPLTELKLRFLVQQNTALSSTFRPFVLRHRRDISTFLDILMVYNMKTIYFLNAYHLGW